MGGMTKAVDSGWAKLKIEACAAEKQARIDSGKDVIVGVNKYRLDEEDAVDIREIDNAAVRDNADRAAASSCAPARRRRRCEHALARADRLRRRRRGQPARPRRSRRCALRATVGEVSDALEAGLGPVPRRHPDDLRRLRRGLRQRRTAGKTCKDEVAAFADAEGRRPRVMIAKLGQDGHDRGAKVVATRLRRPRLRRRHRPAVPDPRGMRAPGDRERRATRSASRRSPPATRRWCRR